jgi:hypothetical protein
MDIGTLFAIMTICFLGAWIIGKVIKKIEKNTFSKIDGFSPTFEQTFITKRSGITGIAIDQDREKLAISTGRGKPNVYEFSQIEGAEIEVNETAIQVSSLTSQATRGAAGALLLGPAGLIIGALSGKKSSNNYLYKLSLKIEVDDVANPIHRVVFYDDKKVKIDAMHDQKWAKDAESWVKRITRITSKNL